MAVALLLDHTMVDIVLVVAAWLVHSIGAEGALKPMGEVVLSCRRPPPESGFLCKVGAIRGK